MQLDEGVRRLYEGSIRIPQRNPLPVDGFVRVDPTALREGTEYWHPSPGLVPAQHAAAGLDGAPGGWRMVKFTVGPGDIRATGVMAPVKQKNETARLEIPVTDVYKRSLRALTDVPRALTEVSKRGLGLPPDAEATIAEFGSGIKGSVEDQLKQLKTKSGKGRRTKRRVTRRHKRSLRKK